jgi:hypothetical protein
MFTKRFEFCVSLLMFVVVFSLVQCSSEQHNESAVMDEGHGGVVQLFRSLAKKYGVIRQEAERRNEKSKNRRKQKGFVDVAVEQQRMIDAGTSTAVAVWDDATVPSTQVTSPILITLQSGYREEPTLTTHGKLTQQSTVSMTLKTELQASSILSALLQTTEQAVVAGS